MTNTINRFVNPFTNQLQPLSFHEIFEEANRRHTIELAETYPRTPTMAEMIDVMNAPGQARPTRAAPHPLRVFLPISHVVLVKRVRACAAPPSQIRITVAVRDELWAEVVHTHPDNYTRKNHPLMPTPTHFMGIPLASLTDEELQDFQATRTLRNRERALEKKLKKMEQLEQMKRPSNITS